MILKKEHIQVLRVSDGKATKEAGMVNKRNKAVSNFTFLQDIEKFA